MSFSADWLALREPYDRAARNGAVLDAVAAAFADRSSVTVTDLGCGAGATLRAMADRLPAGQRWRLVDNDKALLEQASAAARASTAVAGVAAVAADLGEAIESLVGDCDLVTASALLDLVSAAWLERLVAALTRRSLAFYAALSYDGGVALAPASRHDGAVIAAVNAHQHTDKGLGPALGPDAAPVAPQLLRGAGFAVIDGRSDWRFGAGDRAIQMEVLAGWAAAARETGIDASIIDAWLGERRGHVDAGRSHIRVGHIDFFATPTGRR